MFLPPLAVKPDWKYFLRKAYLIAQKSSDPSSQVGALLVNDEGRILAEDANRMPEGILSAPDRWKRPLKYKFVEHAERNAIFQLAKNGVATRGLTMVCTWGVCSDCARAIIQSGVKRLVTHLQAYNKTPKMWQEDIEIAFIMLREAGVEIIMYDGHINTKDIVFAGNFWSP